MNIFSSALNHFQLILLTLVVASAIIGGIDLFFFNKKRSAAIKAKQGFADLSKKQKEKALKAPFWADLAKELFWVLLIVFLLRSFIAEPFRVPSGSLMPTVKIGDWLLVTQYNYSVKTPVWNHMLFKTGKIHQGDISVVYFPVDPNVHFIKRVIGMPGDHISYVNKQLIINGKKMPLTYVKSVLEPAVTKANKLREYKENLNGVVHDIYQNPAKPAVNFYNLVVPKGEYFLMGDDRDFSADSRYWGFVPRKDFVGKALIVFWSWTDSYKPRWDRLFTVIH